MSSKGGKGGWKPSFSRSSSKGKDVEHSDKYGASNSQRSNSISKGGASGSRKQSSGSHDGDYPAHGKSAIPITGTATATGSKPKVLSPGGAKRVDPPSGKDMDYVFQSLTSDPQGRRDSKNEWEHYKELSRRFKSEIEDLKEQLENAKSAIKEKEDAIAQLQELQREKDLLEQQVKGVGDFPNEGNRNADTKSQLSELKSQVDALTKELMVKQSAEIDQLNQLTKELVVERSVTESAKSEMDKLMGQLQQLHIDNKVLDQQMKAGYKEREDRIAELEEFINDQVTELDKMEATMKQTVANKEIAEKELNCEIEELEQKLKASNAALQAEQERVKSRDIILSQLDMMVQNYSKELETVKAEMKEVEDSKLALESLYKQTRAEMDQHIKTLQEQLEKALDPLENIEELKEVVDLGEEIGRGAYGLVKKVSLHGTICAAKDIHTILINYASDEELERIKKSFLEECVKCSKLFHPNIVQFLGIHYPSRQAKLPWLVMELLDCSLTGFIKKYDESISPFVRVSIFCDVSLGLQFLHGQDIIHRDLSSNNILLSKYITAKIGDLGVAKLINPDGSKSHTLAPGTKTFLPPEVFSVKRKYGKPVDVFSLGCVMIHLITHQWPDPIDKTYYDETAEEVIVLKEPARRETYLNKIDDGPYKNLILNCLHDNPKQRPEIAMVVAELQKLKDSCTKPTLFNVIEFESVLKLQQKTYEQLLEKERELGELKKALQE